ncbi:uncharacterized protein LOC120151472 [Hibiscus syriacus]|uniref:uncharacterized protein LOC120151472 n=1 Tax=Hibiscus syriacus TaxID=106335 RepID=UPI001922F67F|nr:uncharacterized protein LOC120151472 [Hibiscus syriacus]
MVEPSNDSFDNGANPYYLYQSDNPGMILVSQLLFNDNFHSWKRSMMLTLSAKNKLGFVDGSIQAPDPSMVNWFNAWTRANNLVNSWLLNSLSKDIAASLLYHTTAAEIWKDLVDRFQQANVPHLFHLKKRLCELVQDKLSLSNYYTQLKIVWDELFSIRQLCSCLQCNCGGVQRMLAEQQQEQVIQLLMGLIESYAHIRGQILLMDPLPPISKVFSLIVQEEHQRNIQYSHPISEPTFAVKSHPSTNTRKNRPLCSHCNLLGHTKDRCYKLIGCPPGYNSKNWSSSTSSRGKSSQVIHTNSVASQQSSPAVTEAFTPEQCQQLIAMLTSQLQSASSLDIPTTSINTAMQDFQFNLLLVSALLNFSNLSVLFCKTNCLIQDLHRVIGKGELVQGLYLLQMSSFNSNISCNTVSSSLSSDWHNRLGHPSIHVMHLLKDVLLLKNVKMKESCQHKSDVNTIIPAFISMVKKQFEIDIKSFRLPSPALNNKSPYEILHGHLPDYNRLRAFSCLFFVATLKSQWDKFSARALPGVFIGYPPGAKGYRFYVLQTQKIVISRNVIPLEHADLNGGASFGSNNSISDALLGSTDSNNNASLEHVESHADVSSDSTASTDEISIPVRGSSRTIQKPFYLQHYYCNNVSSKCLYPIESFVSSSKLSTEYGAFVANISTVVVPSYYHQAIKSSTWRNAMSDELQAMEELGTCTIVPLPSRKSTIDCKWVYRVKYNADGSIDRCKARLVAKGFTQVEGIDYMDNVFTCCKDDLISSPPFTCNNTQLALVVIRCKQSLSKWHTK